MPCATCVRYEYQCEYVATKRHSTTTTQANGDMPSDHHEDPIPPSVCQPSVTELQKHPLTAPGARFHHRSILDPVKTRFVRANSAIAFPRILGMDMESEVIPRLHSFAWHLGLRREEDDADVHITSLLSWPDMQRLTAVYFTQVKPELGFLEEQDFVDRVALRYKSPESYNPIDAVALNVAALGSFFSPTQHPREEDMIRCAKALMISGRLEKSPGLDIVAAWILRSMYLRLTSRPHASWLASCIALHQAEATGLQKDMQTIAVVYPAAKDVDQKLARTRRKLFWIARALNIIFSFEFGRSRINFDVITTKKFDPEPGSHAHLVVELADLLPSDFVDREREPDPPAALGNALTKIEELKTESKFITLLKADLAFAIYRRLWLMSLTDAKDRAEAVLTIGRSALRASERLLESRRPWWNVLHTPFQFICVSIAVDTPRSLSYIAEAMQLLQKIAEVYPTHIVQEACNQAAALVKMSRVRKERQLEVLQNLPSMPQYEDHPSVGSGNGLVAAPNMEWAVDMPFEWEYFLNPDLVVSSQQQLQFDNADIAGFGNAVSF